MRDLRNLTGRASLLETSALCNLVWQGDLGNNQQTGSGIFDPGADPCALSPALPTGGTSNMVSGISVRAFKIGDRVRGDYGTEWTYCRLVLASTTDLLPGQVYQIDENFSASQTTISGQVLSEAIGVGMVFSPATVAGTYFLWLATRGNIGVRDAGGSVLGGEAETTATAGAVKFKISHTSTSLTLQRLVGMAASSNITFTGNTVNGSPYITAVASQISLEGSTGGITDLLPGQTITGTNLPSNSCIAALEKINGVWRASIGTATTGAQKTLQNATGTATGTTFTVTTLVQAVARDPLGATAAT